jgi:hypothetical protein
MNWKVPAFFIAAARLFFDAFVLLEYWRWFVRPLGAPTIGYFEAFGLDCCIGLVAIPSNLALLSPQEPADDDDGERLLAKALVGWLVYGWALGLGFCVHLAAGARQ